MKANAFRSTLAALLILGMLAACAPATPTPATLPATAEPTSAPSLATPLPKGLTATPTPLTLYDALGRKVTLNSPARRVVSLAPSNTELMYQIGTSTFLVGRDDFSDYPEAVKTKPSVGGSLGKYDYEAIAALNPDLVLAAGINTPEQVKALEDLGLTVYEVPNPVDFSSLFDNIVTLSQMLGREQRGLGVTRQLNARVTYVRGQIEKTQERPLVYYELDATDPTKPYTAGPDSFVDMIISGAGGANIAAGLADEWGQISQEEIIAKDPDYILLGDGAYGVTPASLAARPGWENLKAVKNNHVIVVDDNLFSRPTARMVDGLEQLAKMLHPDLFK